MDHLRNMLDRWGEAFRPGRRWEAWQPLYEAVDTIFYTPGKVTRGASHLRDGVDLKRIMIMVWLATFPAMFWGMYNVGHRANTLLAAGNVTPTSGWRHQLLELLSAYDPASIVSCLLHGAVWFLPIYLVTFFVGGFWEVLFAMRRRHEINEGFFVSSILFALSCPPSIPLWQVAIGISFGIVIGKEIFGGTGKNFMNPALCGRAFLYFAYPAQLSGDSVWTVVDGYTSASPLSVAAAEGIAGLRGEFTWLSAFLGQIDGSFGETSTLAILIGGAVLLFSGIASWRIVAGALLGTIASAWLFALGAAPDSQLSVPWYWHLVLGGYAFGLIFMATEPVTAAVTDAGRWIYGALIGVMVVLIRVANPAYPEGMMLAILFANCFASLIDYFVAEFHIRRRTHHG